VASMEDLAIPAPGKPPSFQELLPLSLFLFTLFSWSSREQMNLRGQPWESGAGTSLLSSPPPTGYPAGDFPALRMASPIPAPQSGCPCARHDLCDPGLSLAVSTALTAPHLPD
jgi:hypothetical protein